MTKFLLINCYRQHAVKGLLTGVCVFVFLFLPAGAGAEYGNSSISVDELLEYTLTNLQARMQEVIFDNNKFLEKNGALQKRVNSLDRYIEDFKKRKDELSQQIIDVKNKIKTERKLQSFSEQEVQDLYEEIKRLKQEQEDLQGQLKKSPGDKLVLEKEIIGLEKDIEKIRQANKNPNAFSVKQRYKQEKAKFKKLVKKYKRQVRQAERKLVRLKKSIVSLNAQKQPFWEKQTLLQKEILILKNVLQRETEKTAGLEREIGIISGQTQQTTEQAKKQIAELKTVREKMEKMLDELRSVKQVLVKEQVFDKQQFNDFKAVLGVEKQLLSEKADAAREFTRMVDNNDLGGAVLSSFEEGLQAQARKSVEADDTLAVEIANSPGGKKSEQIIEEIDELRLRSIVLSNSLAAVKSRYNAENLLIKEFNKEEKQLQGYLSVLRQENERLKDKQATAKMALDNLKK